MEKHQEMYEIQEKYEIHTQGPDGSKVHLAKFGEHDWEMSSWWKRNF